MDFDKSLEQILNKEQILKNEPMKKHTSFRIGGNADYFLKIKTQEELKQVLEVCKKFKKEIFIIGNGTNLLVTDKGFRGVIIKLELNNLELKQEDKEFFITVEAGYPLTKLSKFALDNELEGLEFACGIPGTIGGAIRMNAGAYGGEMKNIVVSTKYMDLDGNINELNLEEQEFSYRNSIFSKKEFIILSTTVKLKKGDKENIKQKVLENNQSRIKNQPLEFPNAGSTFKRKEGVITAKLIDEAGLKGYSIGDACVSTKHAGFLINKGNATFEDMNKLIKYIQKTLLEKYNVQIELEVLVIGEI
ncbi:MAG: UDP-N-acetylmuramate dehydrogenase [Clostridia bacterium]|nr:UDP-N-acetylmuramate dehydrogenase [Clostridia bacterium]